MNEVNYIKCMIVELEKSIVEAASFGDMVTVNSIENQIQMYKRRLEELSK